MSIFTNKSSFLWALQGTKWYKHTVTIDGQYPDDTVDTVNPTKVILITPSATKYSTSGNATGYTNLGRDCVIYNGVLESSDARSLYRVISYNSNDFSEDLYFSIHDETISYVMYQSIISDEVEAL